MVKKQAEKPVDNPQPTDEMAEKVDVPETNLEIVSQEEIKQKQERINLANRRRFLLTRREVPYDELKNQAIWNSKKPQK